MKLKLLLVEDDETLLREMTAYFSGCYDVYAAASLAAAREYLADNAPDAAVLDLILPDRHSHDDGRGRRPRGGTRRGRQGLPHKARISAYPRKTSLRPPRAEIGKFARLGKAVHRHQ